MNSVGLRIYEKQFGRPQMVSRDLLQEWIKGQSSKIPGWKFSTTFVLSEWDDLVDAWQLHTWEQYRDVKRLGRKTRLSEPQRQMLWGVFQTIIKSMNDKGLVSLATVFSKLSDNVRDRTNPVFDHVVVDEAQDISVAQLRFLAAVAGVRPNESSSSDARHPSANNAPRAFASDAVASLPSRINAIMSNRWILQYV